MRSDFFAVGIVSTMVVLAGAHAQEIADPVTQSYVAYRAAIERGDSAAAEQAAAAALAASEARDGDGGRTAVLAYNLALVRLDAGSAQQAQGPAARALALAESQGTASGLDPLWARLALGQAELAADPLAGRQRLLAALAETAGRTDVDDRAYAAGAALGRWAFEAGQFDVAYTAWSTAASHVRGDTASATLTRARARVGEAVALIVQHAGNPRHHARDDAYAILNNTMNELYPYALIQPDDFALTPFQIAYAEAKAWRDYGRALHTASPPAVVRRNVAGQIMCDVRWRGDSMIDYTLGLAYNSDAGGVAVFRMIIDDDGAVTRIDVASQAPVQDLSQSVTPHLERLRAARTSDSARDCIMPQVVFHTVILEDTSTRRLRPRNREQ